jgi:hypothetical protein
VTVEETFSTLLRQLEDAIAGDAAVQRGRAPRSNDARGAAARVAPGLSRASARMSELAQHIVDGMIAPYRLRADGSFASIAATLLDAHRSLCEAAIALAAAGAPGGRASEAPRLVAACPSGHAMRDDLVSALEVTPEVRAIVLESDFASLPALVRLLEPEYVVVARAEDAVLEDAWRRTATSRSAGTAPTRMVALGGASDAESAPADVRLDDAEALRRWIGELASGADAEPQTGVEIGLEIVTV